MINLKVLLMMSLLSIGSSVLAAIPKSGDIDRPCKPSDPGKPSKPCEY